MVQELFYTSAPRGLKEGSQGFCAVTITQGLPAALQERLESLSGYRHVFPPHDPNAERNPVVLSHLRLDFGGRSVSVLSRVGAAGVDYSGRTNKFAHHVVLGSDEQPAAGPAWLLARSGFMAHQWDGQVRVLADGRAVPQGDIAARVCIAWQEATGDAGWAGVLAQSFLDDPARVAYIVYNVGTDVLPLLAEAVALLPAAKRWRVTFSTYYTASGVPQSVLCNWRCVPRDSDEARTARRTRDALVISLGEQRSATPDGPLVEQARTGVAAPAARIRAAPDAKSSRQPLAPDDFAMLEIAQMAAPRKEPAPRRAAFPFPVMDRANDAAPNDPPPMPEVQPPREFERPHATRTPQQPATTGRRFNLFIAALLFVVVVGFLFRRSWNRAVDRDDFGADPVTNSAPQAESSESRIAPRAANDSTSNTRGPKSGENDGIETGPVGATPTQKATSQPPVSGSQSVDLTPPRTKSSNVQSEESVDRPGPSRLPEKPPLTIPDKLVRTSKPPIAVKLAGALEFCPLPEPNYTGGLFGTASTRILALARGRPIDVTLLGGGALPDIGRLSIAADAPGERWSIRLDERTVPLATLEARDEGLRFTFSGNESYRAAHEALRDCVLELTYPKERRRVVLRSQLRVDPLRPIHGRSEVETSYLWNPPSHSTRVDGANPEPRLPLFLNNCRLITLPYAEWEGKRLAPKPEEIPGKDGSANVRFRLWPPGLRAPDEESIFVNVMLMSQPAKGIKMLKVDMEPRLSEIRETAEKARQRAADDKTLRELPDGEIEETLKKLKHDRNLAEKEGADKLKLTELERRIYRGEKQLEDRAIMRLALEKIAFIEEHGQLAVCVDVCYKWEDVIVVAARVGPEK